MTITPISPLPGAGLMTKPYPTNTSVIMTLNGKLMLAEKEVTSVGQGVISMTVVTA